jgi:hypothetical protein
MLNRDPLCDIEIFLSDIQTGNQLLYKGKVQAPTSSIGTQTRGHQSTLCGLGSMALRHKVAYALSPKALSLRSYTRKP